MRTLTTSTWRRPGRLLVVTVAAAAMPVVVAAAGALRRGWVPTGDNAIFAIRARDVLSTHPPLLGTWTSASRQLGTDINNPGPLLFDLLALPVTLVPGGAGIVVGVALLNVTAIIGLTTVAHRLGGAWLAAAAAGSATLLSFAMGSELLFQPWQPHSLLLPFLLYLFLVWGLSAGDSALLPWAVVVGSLLLQTHLSYAFLVVGLGGWAVASALLSARRGKDRREARPLTIRTCVIATAVLLACWAQPVVEQLSAGRGNLGRLAGATAEPPETLAFGSAVRALAEVAATPPWTSFRTLSLQDRGSMGMAVAVLAALVAVLTGCALRARRLEDVVMARGVETVSVGLVVGLFTLWRTPPAAIFLPFGLASHHLLWLWPVTALLALVVAQVLVGRHRSAGRSTVAVVVLTIALAVATLPTGDRGSSQPSWTSAVQRQLDPHVAGLVGCGPLLVDAPAYGVHFDTGVMAELQRRDIEFVVEDRALIRQLGPSRRFDGRNADAVLHLLIGDDAGRPPPGARFVGRHDGLDGPERRERDRLGSSIRAEAERRGPLPLSETGRVALRRGLLEGVDPTATTIEPAKLFPPQGVPEMAQMMLSAAELDDRWRGQLERYVDLVERDERETAALYLTPQPPGEVEAAGPDDPAPRLGPVRGPEACG